MPIVSLNDTTIRSLKPAEAQITYWDEGLKNFGLRVSPGGTMTWTLLVGQERQRIKLGNYPILSLKLARELARRRLAERTLGQHRPRTKTFSDALQTFGETHCAGLRPKTVYELQRLIRKHFLKKLGNKALADISAEDITDITDKLSRGTAWHAHAAVGNFFAWAVPRYIKHNPLTGVRRPSKSTPRSRVLTDDELKSIWKACDEPTNDLPVFYPVIVKLLILTGQRRSEIAALRTSWIKENTITLPSEITKNGREHTFPIGTLAARFASNADTEGEFLFPARGKSNSPFNGWSKSKVALDKISGVEDWTLHDLRRTMSTRLAEMSVAPHVIEKLLNHISGQISGVAAIYNRATYMAEMKVAVDLWENRLQTILKS